MQTVLPYQRKYGNSKNINKKQTPKHTKNNMNNKIKKH